MIFMILKNDQMPLQSGRLDHLLSRSSYIIESYNLSLAFIADLRRRTVYSHAVPHSAVSKPPEDSKPAELVDEFTACRS